MEAVSSKDGTPFLDLNATRNRAEFACSISSLPIGITLNKFQIQWIWFFLNYAITGNSERRVAESLDRIRSRILIERSSEKANKIAGANTRSIVFFVTSSISSEKDKIKSVLLKMLQEMPGKTSDSILQHLLVVTKLDELFFKFLLRCSCHVRYLG